MFLATWRLSVARLAGSCRGLNGLASVAVMGYFGVPLRVKRRRSHNATRPLEQRGRPRDQRENTVNQLVAYMLENLILDFQGDLTLDMVRDFLREDDTKAAHSLLVRLVEDGGVSDMMICIADCLSEAITKGGISPQLVTEQLTTYAES